MILYLAHYLLHNYERDERIRRLVDETEIFLMPSMNPDGYEKSSPGCGGFSLFGFGAKAGRNNAQGKDLNRDFPKQFDEPQNIDDQSLEAGRQPETV